MFACVVGNPNTHPIPLVCSMRHMTHSYWPRSSNAANDSPKRGNHTQFTNVDGGGSLLLSNPGKKKGATTSPHRALLGEACAAYYSHVYY
jgi:hypothetical protein